MTEKAMTEKSIDGQEFIDSFYPISVYSRFTGKDSTRILDYDGDSIITYLCLETKKTETVNLREVHIAKLNWKMDWPMRWQYEGVIFEPAGADHASPGGSYDVSSVIAREIFEYEPPLFVEYLFVGIRGLGAKMSGSKGNAISPKDLLEIYEPDLLKWLYIRKVPKQSFELAFDSEIYRQYDEYDREFSDIKRIPFRQLVGFGQIVQWDMQKLFEIIKASGFDYDEKVTELRAPLAKNWLEKYNETERISLNDSANTLYATDLNSERILNIKTLRAELLKNPSLTISEIEFLSYQIPKRPEIDETDLKKIQREFFKDVYNMLIGKDTGPRLGTFLWAIDREKVIELLNV